MAIAVPAVRAAIGARRTGGGGPVGPAEGARLVGAAAARAVVGLAEAAVYRVVHFLDEEVENERLTLQYTDPALPEDSWEGHLDNPPGFASDMFAKHGVDFEKRYADSEPGQAR